MRLLKNKTIVLFGLILVVGVLFFSVYWKQKTLLKTSNLTKIKVGWQTPWATQGQLTQILKHTDLLQKNGLVADFKGFDFGAPLNEAALAKGVDVIFTADQPAATLFTKSQDWVIIGRLMYNRVSLYVPPRSPITNVAELKGKTVAMPFGAAAQRVALKAEVDAGLNPTKDVNNINLGILEQGDLVKDSNAVRWGKIDALAGFDPTPAIFESKGLIRNLATGKVVSVIVMSKDFIKVNPDAPVKFLKAFYDSYDYYRNNIDQADNWFVEESNLSVSHDVFKTCSDIEPNLSVKNKSDIRIGFTDDDYNVLQDAADFIFNQSLVKTKVNMRDFVDVSYLQKSGLH
ncbi:MAG: hypothetical protein UT00_C0019G0004 [Parcubacteria group bacterium GW2011_GWA1_38_7]|nr:MAG: hypothetical protein UT00_C0019G0004 [Parcubacteria group bacterium GW2011_GWA1_38_7]